jgi:site-specific DNA-methyltransferase (adenine-specific)
MAKEFICVLKLGDYILSFGGTRTYHRMACVIEDVGFEIRDVIQWIYGSEFPKSLLVKQLIKCRAM